MALSASSAEIAMIRPASRIPAFTNTATARAAVKADFAQRSGSKLTSANPATHDLAVRIMEIKPTRNFQAP